MIVHAFRRGRRRLLLLAGLAVLAAATALTVGITSGAYGAAIPQLPSVGPDKLAANGITLSVPASEARAVGRDVAENAARAAFPFAPVNGAVLAMVHDEHAVPKLDKVMWAVDMSPPGGFPPPAGPKSSENLRESYFIVFIDASSGQPLFARYG